MNIKTVPFIPHKQRDAARLAENYRNATHRMRENLWAMKLAITTSVAGFIATIGPFVYTYFVDGAQSLNFIFVTFNLFFLVASFGTAIRTWLAGKIHRDTVDMIINRLLMALEDEDKMKRVKHIETVIAPQ
jgi:hypothetical protein